LSFFDAVRARPLGKGMQAPSDSVVDPSLARMVANYKRTVAARYRSIAPDEIEYVPEGRMHVSPKIDGHMWFMVFDAGQPFLVNPAGRVIYGDVPLLAEAQQFVSRVNAPRAVFAGELFAVRKEGRPRFDGVPEALGGEEAAPVGKLGWACFDVVDVTGTPGGSQNDPYEDRLELIRKVFDGGKRVRAIKTETVSRHDDVKRLYAEWVDGGKGEGLVIRSRDARTWKLKPVFTLDAAVIGYTERSDAPEQIRSVLLALMREDGKFQLIGSCGNLGNDADRSSLMQQLQPTLCESNYRFADRSGELYRFVRATMVMEIRVTDLQVENASGRDVNRMVLELRDDGWFAMRPFPGVSLIHPVLSRIREDKGVNPVDIRAAQVLERVPVSQVGDAAQAVDRQGSEVLRRTVWVKETKGVKAVRKLLQWRTHKEMDDPDFPAFVTVWVDYSPGRLSPLSRDVRRSATRAEADRVAQEMIDKGVKRGWNEVGA
jgi:hypothetical protein